MDRRTTLLQPQDALRTGIPMPTTSRKPPLGTGFLGAGPTPQNNHRMSIGGPALRAPAPLLSQGSQNGYGSQGHGSQSGPRQSIAPGMGAPRQSMAPPGMGRSQQMNPLLMSTSKGKTPLHSSVRKGSLWPGTAGAGLPSSTQAPAKDNRPLRERPYQQKMRNDIVSVLQDQGYDITMSTLLNITGKDFRAMVQFFIQILDENYEFNPQARFEEEFVPALKAVNYPFASQIDTKWLAAPASMHSWPALLGALHWLAQLCRLKSCYVNSTDPTLLVAENVPIKFDLPEHHHAILFEFYTDSYLAFMDDEEGDNPDNDMFRAARAKFEERYAQCEEVVKAEWEVERQVKVQVATELKKLEASQSNLKTLRADHEQLLSDSDKFSRMTKQYDDQRKKYIDKIALHEADIASRRLQITNLTMELTRLQQIVETQNLSPEEVIRMNTDHETLTRNIEDLNAKLKDTLASVQRLEVTVAKRVEAAEEALQSYTHYINSLGLYAHLPPPLDAVNLLLELNPASQDASGILLGSDIRTVIKPALSTLAEQKRTERADVERERIRLDHELDQLTVECEELSEEVEGVEKKVAALNEQARELRDTAAQEVAVSSGEAERLERELAMARNAALASGMGVKARLSSLQIEYQEQIAKTDKLKDDAVRAILKNGYDIGMFKANISRHLQELKDFVDDD